MSLPALDLSPSNATPSERRHRWQLSEPRMRFLAAALALVAGMYAVDTLPIGGFYDDAFYVILAKSIATGQGYRNLNLPGAPFATHYPPGYPLLLAALWKIGPAFPANLILFKVANAFFLAVAAVFAYRLGRERFGLGAGVALLATAAGTMTTPALFLSSMVMSETMFLALAVPYLLWAEQRVTREERDLRSAMWLGACAGLLFLVRSQAVALVGAVVLVYAVRRRWRECALTIGAAGVVVLPWLLWVSAHDAAFPTLMRGDYGSYFAWFTDGIREHGLGIVRGTLRRNLPDMFNSVANQLRPPANPLPNAVTSICFTLLAVSGVIGAVRRAPVTLAFVGGYVALVALWPFQPVRFVFAIWVLIMLVVALGGETLLDWRSPNVAWHRANLRLTVSVAGAIAAFILVAGLAAYSVRAYQGRWWAMTQKQSGRWIQPKKTWVATQTDTAAVIATDHDEGAIYLYTGRHSVPVTTFTASEYVQGRPIETDSAVLQTLAGYFHAQYIVLSSPGLQPAAAAISTSAVRLDDGVHKVVPWAFTLNRRASR